MTKIRRRFADRVVGFVRDWSLPRQIAGESPYSKAAESSLSRNLRPRLSEADKVGTIICPYCAVGCAQLAYAKNGRLIHVEGDPTFGWLTSEKRLDHVLYRAPYGERWERRPLDWAMDRIAWLLKQTRDDTFVDKLPDGTAVNHTLAVASLGGATLDNEENYLIKKLFGGGLGLVWIENQARV